MFFGSAILSSATADADSLPGGKRRRLEGPITEGMEMGGRRRRTRRNRRRSTKAQNNESPGEKQCSGRSLAVISVLITAREGDYARHYALSREKRKGKKGKWKVNVETRRRASLLCRALIGRLVNLATVYIS